MSTLDLARVPGCLECQHRDCRAERSRGDLAHVARRRGRATNPASVARLDREIARARIEMQNQVDSFAEHLREHERAS